jgi:hypothetical protein
MPTKTVSQPRNKAETPFLSPTWPCNFSVLGGIPTRTRCHSVVADDEASTGLELVAFYRVQELISSDNNIETKSDKLNQSFRVKTLSGVEQENLRREISKCDNEKYLAAEAKLAALRTEAFELVQPIVKRLVKSLSDELNDAALDAEQRLDKAGLPIRAGASWLLHDDAICKALWSCRFKAEVLLTELSVENSIGVVQFFLTDEEHTPFSW